MDGDSIGNDARKSHSRGSHKALSYGQLCDSDKEVARTKYCDKFAFEELIFTELPLRSSYLFFLGFCIDFSAPKYVDRVSLDEIGTSDILEVENATLKSSDRDMLLNALSSRVNNEQIRIADKDYNIYVPNPKDTGFFIVSRYQHEPNNQVVDFSYGFNLSKDQDHKEVLETLKSRPRLAVFEAWLSPAADEEIRQQHIGRVADLARLQEERHRGFLIISEPILGREKNRAMLWRKFSRD